MANLAVSTTCSEWIDQEIWGAPWIMRWLEANFGVLQFYYLFLMFILQTRSNALSLGGSIYPISHCCVVR